MTARVDHSAHLDLDQLASIAEVYPDAVLVVAFDRAIVGANRHIETLLGYDRHELLGQSLELLLPERHRHAHTQSVREYFGRPSVHPMAPGLSVHARHKTGQEIPVGIVLSPVDLEDGRFVIATIRDETEHQRHLAQSNEMIWRLVFDEPLPLDLPETEQVERFLEGCLADTNLHFVQQYGYEEVGAMDGVRLREIMPPDDPETVPTLLKVIRTRFSMKDLITFERDRYGSEKVFENTFFGDISDNKVSSLWGTARDVTARYEAERENRIRAAALDAVTNGCIITDALADDMPIILVNQGFTEMTGYSHEEVMGKNCRFLQGPGTDPTMADSIRETIRREESFEGEILNYRKDGSPFWNLLRLAPVRDRHGKVARYVGSLQDVTDERESALALTELRQSLEHVSRTAGMGELTAAIAHEINQPLTAISANVSAALKFIKAESPNLQEITEILEDIAADDRRAADIVLGLRSLLKKETSRRNNIQINDLVSDTLKLVRPDLIMKQVTVITELGRDLPMVEGDAVQIQQVMLNLLANAREAVESSKSGHRQITITTSYEDSGDVRFSVRDSGPGFSEGDLERVFDPFYTTKKDGMGMGLAINRTIVEAHGGRLWAENSEDRGARVGFELPSQSDT